MRPSRVSVLRSLRWPPEIITRAVWPSAKLLVALSNRTVRLIKDEDATCRAFIPLSSCYNTETDSFRHEKLEIRLDLTRRRLIHKQMWF